MASRLDRAIQDRRHRGRRGVATIRTFGRVTNQDGSKAWYVIETAPSGDNSQVYLTTLAQCFSLNLNESPFFGDWGLPAHPSVIQQLPPDTWVNLMQQRFARFFASLIVFRVPGSNPPTYQVNAVTLQGAVLTVVAAGGVLTTPQ